MIYILLATAPNVAWLFVGYAFAGVVGAIATTVNAYLADITPPEERAGRYGMMGAAFGSASSSDRSRAGCSAASRCACRCTRRAG